jgi:hypothetical protein
MQLDQTRIAIRERGYSEILGLALQVTRAHAPGLALALVIGVLPFALFNYWLLQDSAVGLWEEDIESVLGFMFGLLIIVALEAPFATAPITLYLGQITFSRKADIKEMAFTLLGALPQLILLQGIARSFLFFILLIPYWYQPYLGELILLERNPLLGRKRLTTLRRSRNLHANSGGEIFARWVLACIVGLAAIVAFSLFLLIMLAQLGSIEMELSTWLMVLYHGVLWLVFGWMAVVRFLAYLDTRIRHEGWEVELLMRAEAQRLRRQLGIAGA